MAAGGTTLAGGRAGLAWLAFPDGAYSRTANVGLTAIRFALVRNKRVAALPVVQLRSALRARVAVQAAVARGAVAAVLA